MVVAVSFHSNRHHLDKHTYEVSTFVVQPLVRMIPDFARSLFGWSFNIKRLDRWFYFDVQTIKINDHFPIRSGVQLSHWLLQSEWIPSCGLWLEACRRYAGRGLWEQSSVVSWWLSSRTAWKCTSDTTTMTLADLEKFVTGPAMYKGWVLVQCWWSLQRLVSGFEHFSLLNMNCEVPWLTSFTLSIPILITF